MLAWIKKSWFRHILTLRPFWYPRRRNKGVGLGLQVMSIWDEGWHANHPILISALVIRWEVMFGIKDTN